MGTVLRKRHAIGRIIGMPKNTETLVHSRRCSINNLIMNLMSAPGADNKPHALSGFRSSLPTILVLF